MDSYYSLIRFLCYECMNQGVELLNELIACQSEYLTPVNILRIIKDIIRSVASLQDNFIYHGCIEAKAIIIYLPSRVINK